MVLYKNALSNDGTLNKQVTDIGFGFEGWIWVLIASVPDLCTLLTFNAEPTISITNTHLKSC